MLLFIVVESHAYCFSCVFVGNLSTSFFYGILWRWGPETYEDWLNKIYKSLDLNFISIKNMKWKFSNMYKISFENIKHFWNQETKTKNKETFHISSRGIPSTPQHFDSRPCIRPPSRGTQWTQNNERAYRKRVSFGKNRLSVHFQDFRFFGTFPWLPKPIVLNLESV